MNRKQFSTLIVLAVVAGLVGGAATDLVSLESPAVAQGDGVVGRAAYLITLAEEST